MECLLPPVKQTLKVVQGVKTFNRDAFNRAVRVPGLRITKRDCHDVLNELKDADEPKMISKRTVTIDPEDSDYRIIPLQPSFVESPFRLKIDEVVAKGCGVLCKVDVPVNIAEFNHDDVIDHVLGDELGGVRRVSVVGHIGHINLCDDYLPFKRIVGDIVLACNPDLRTVVRKTAAVSGLYRLNEFEVLAGDNDMQVVHVLNGCTFKFDFSKAFWNSRLAFQHTQLVETLAQGSVLCDMFAGCGPFSVPAAKKLGCRVYANDLNPACAEAMRNSAKVNRVEKKISIFNLDARQFLRELVCRIKADHEYPEAAGSKQWPMFTDVTMNLPRTALQFLDAFEGILAGAEHLPMPMVHVYCFGRDEEAHVLQKAREYLKVNSLGPETTVTQGRTIDPGVLQYRLSFRLPKAVAHRRTPDSQQPMMHSSDCG